MRTTTVWTGRVGTGLVVTALAAVAVAATTAKSVALAPNGDAIDGSAGAPVALSPTSLVVSAEGADGVAGTSDDVTLFVSNLGTTPVVTPLPTPYGSPYSSRITRLSFARAALCAAGQDGTFGTADDELMVLDRLGSQNRVLRTALGGLGDNQQFTPEKMSADRIAVAAIGADLKANTADDEIIVVDGVSTDVPVAQRYPAPYLQASGRTQAIALSESTVVVASNGADKKPSTADDVVHVLRGIGTPTVTSLSLPAPGLNRRAAGRAVRLSETTALVVAAGADLLDSTADDELLLLDTVAGTSTPVAVPYVVNASGGRPVVLAPGLAICSTLGADGTLGTGDDAVAVVAGLDGATPTVTSIPIGAFGDDNNCRPTRLAADAFAMVSFGDDATVGTPDDEVVYVSGIGGTVQVQRVTVGAVATGTTSTVVALSPTSVLVAAGGEDGIVGTLDDELLVLTDLGGTPAVEHVAAGGALDEMNSFRYVAQVLGGGRAALLATGPDAQLGVGGDDALRVLEGLETANRLRVTRLRVTRPKEGSTKATKLKLAARLSLAAPTSILDGALTVTVGNAAQTLPASSLTVKRGVVRYDDLRNERGFVRTLRFKLKNGKLSIDARGADAELAATDAGYVPVGFELGDEGVTEAVTARARGRSIVYGK